MGRWPANDEFWGKCWGISGAGNDEVPLPAPGALDAYCIVDLYSFQDYKGLLRRFWVPAEETSGQFTFSDQTVLDEQLADKRVKERIDSKAARKTEKAQMHTTFQTWTNRYKKDQLKKKDEKKMDEIEIARTTEHADQTEKQQKHEETSGQNAAARMAKANAPPPGKGSPPSGPKSE